MTRKIGQTTRIVDKTIQNFFKHGEVNLSDHYPGHQMQRYVLGIFLHRLEMEHHIALEDLYISYKDSYTFVKMGNGKGSD